jgi:3-oxoadipate enol-lactonase/4-carboxymuconolactone decarboxylase
VTSSFFHHIVEGPEAAPALLLVNSLGNTREMWAPMLPELRRHFRVLRYDQRGHGGSPVTPGPYTLEQLGRDALAVLDHAGVARAHVCGVSLGGMVGQWLAVHEPARVERLAIICSSPRLGPPESWHARAELVRTQGMQAVSEAVVARWFTPAFAARAPKIVARVRAMIETTPPEGYAGCCEAIARWDIVERLREIAAPTWIVAGADDPSTPPSHAYLMAAHIPGARVDVLAQTAHLAVCEHPLPLARMLIEHLTGERAHGGEHVRRAVLGDAHVDRARANTTPFTAAFQDFITRYAWGEIWSRPGLARPQRSLITLSVLAALHHDEELAMYAGVPAANRAFAVAQRTLRELDEAELAAWDEPAR